LAEFVEAERISTDPIERYTGPVHEAYFADPFVWRQGDRYYAIGTAAAEAAGEVRDRVFPVMFSDDLFEGWQPAGEALVRLPEEAGDTYWAPEIAAADGRFYLYYSVGFADNNHRLRVACSADPLGPYIDLEVYLTRSTCPFAIDPHPFRDEDGAWYLFYATDFLDRDPGVRPGTALVVDRLVQMDRLEGNPRVVARANADWQRFQSDRVMYGERWDWHTLEGPCVIKYGTEYYCFYSGGRWETSDYGVDYCIASSPLGPYRHKPHFHPRVLRSMPDLRGPGHNSVVSSPDGNLYMAYHAWNSSMTRRQMHIAQLVWTSEGPRVIHGLS
jgi:beta-xylosidase